MNTKKFKKHNCGRVYYEIPVGSKMCNFGPSAKLWDWKCSCGSNMTFAADQETVDRLVSKGIDSVLLPKAEVCDHISIDEDEHYCLGCGKDMAKEFAQARASDVELDWSRFEIRRMK